MNETGYKQPDVLVVKGSDGLWDAFCIEPDCFDQNQALTLAVTPSQSAADRAAAAHRKWHREDYERQLAAVPCPTCGRAR